MPLRAETIQQRKRFKAFSDLLSDTPAESNGLDIDRSAHTCRFLAVELDGDSPIWAYQGETLAEVIKDIERTDTEDVSRTVIYDLDTKDQTFDVEHEVRVTRLHDNVSGGWKPAPGTVPAPSAKQTAIVIVRGGVAEVAEEPDGVAVEIVDFDNLDDLLADESLGKDSIVMNATTREYLQRADPKFFKRLERKLEVLTPAADSVNAITTARAEKDAIAKQATR